MITIELDTPWRPLKNDTETIIKLWSLKNFVVHALLEHLAVDSFDLYSAGLEQVTDTSLQPFMLSARFFFIANA